jgi:hypothetical protein
LRRAAGILTDMAAFPLTEAPLALHLLSLTFLVTALTGRMPAAVEKQTPLLAGVASPSTMLTHILILGDNVVA